MGPIKVVRFVHKMVSVFGQSFSVTTSHRSLGSKICYWFRRSMRRCPKWKSEETNIYRDKDVKTKSVKHRIPSSVLPSPLCCLLFAFHLSCYWKYGSRLSTRITDSSLTINLLSQKISNQNYCRANNLAKSALKIIQSGKETHFQWFTIVSSQHIRYDLCQFEQ